MNLDNVKKLIQDQKFLEAANALDDLLKYEKENDELWYLRGIVSLRLKKYSSADEYFIRALVIKKKPEYFRLKGVVALEIFDLENAVSAFDAAIETDPKDHLSYFFLSIAHMLMDQLPEAAECLKMAKELDAKKTKQLLSNFYVLFVQNNVKTSEAQKRKIEEKIKNISIN